MGVRGGRHHGPARPAGARGAGAATRPSRGATAVGRRPGRGRHRHRRRRRGVAGVLATWLISSAKEAPEQPPAAGPVATAQGGPTSRPPGPGAFGNLVVNWSFEQDLTGWQVLGAADASREPQGRTSGSCASVRARGPEPGQVGLALPEVVATAERGQRYVASAWVRSSASGQQVTVRLVGRRRQGGLQEDRGHAARPGVAAGHRRPHRGRRRPAAAGDRGRRCPGRRRPAGRRGRRPTGIARRSEDGMDPARKTLS